MKRPGIRSRVLFAMMLVIVSFLVLTSWVVDGLVDRFLRAEVESALERGRQACERFSQLRHALLLDQARSVAQVPHLRAVLDAPDVDEQTVAYSLETLQKVIGAPLLFVCDSRARLLAETGPSTAPADALVGLEPIESALHGEEYCGALDFGGEPYLVAICPVTIDSSVLGLLGIGSPLSEYVDDLQRVTGCEVALVLETICLQAGGSFAEALAWSECRSRVPAHVEVAGRELIAMSMPFGEGSERIVLSRPLDKVLGYFRSAKIEIGLSALALLALALIVSRRIADKIARPLGELMQATNKLASGDLSAAVRVTSDDEVGRLGGTFNAMARELEHSMQRALEKARAAEEAAASKSVFLATMSHELRTPLNAIVGFAQLLQESALDAEQREQVGCVRSSGHELLKIIDDILSLSRLDTGRLELELRPFDVHACLSRAFAEVQTTLLAKGIGAGMSIGEDVPRILVGPVERVRRVVRHYLDNAVKFTSSGSIALRARVAHSDDKTVLLKVEVEDTGIGIPPDKIEHLFKPFAQLDDGSNRAYGGAGLGLALCKELALLMDGQVGVTSTAGRGSLFWFTARLGRPDAQSATRWSSGAIEAQPAPAAPPPAPLPAASASSARGRVLVAEDNLVNQKVTCAILRRAGLDYAVACDGQEAIERLARERFDVVLMDCQMPNVDGLGATRAIRAAESGTHAHVPIIALTANALPSDREACLAAGMDAFLAKPVDAGVLTREVDRWLKASARPQPLERPAPD